MIATCPKCNSRFRVEFSVIGPEGRNVKCGECAEVWFQEQKDSSEEEQEDDENARDDIDPDLLDDVLNSIEDNDIDDQQPKEGVFDEEVSGVNAKERTDFKSEDIPEALKAEGKDPFITAFLAEEQSKEKLYGFGAAGGVFILTLLFFLFLHGPVTQAWPVVQGAYGIFGKSIKVPGEGLVFDRMHVVEKNGAIYVEGHILNLENVEKIVPIIEASLLSKGGEVLSKWYILPPKETLDGEGTLAFQSAYKGDAHAAQVANKAQIRFTIKSRTVAKGAGNTHAPPETDQAHQSAHEEP